MSVPRATVADTRFVSDDAAWRSRVESDASKITALLPPHLGQLHSAVVERATAAGAASLILAGSTARGSRTDISDLDYHLIGRPIDTSDLSRELDLHVLSADELEAHLLAGDDFVQWSLRYGLVVFDSGPAQEALALIQREALWPDPARKRRHAAKSLELAVRFVATGDQDGAIVQVRTALSLAARAHLLGIGIFPLSRAELPRQLRQAGEPDIAAMLAACINTTPSLNDLEQALALGADLLSAAPSNR